MEIINILYKIVDKVCIDKELSICDFCIDRDADLATDICNCWNCGKGKGHGFDLDLDRDYENEKYE